MFLLLRAVDFAACKHRDQRLRDRQASPYINHPVSVALILAETGGIRGARPTTPAKPHSGQGGGVRGHAEPPAAETSPSEPPA
ncbi:MAG: hypothetical protein ACOC8N_07160 [Spirochaetota bacterium]